ncbi:MAG TPA: hypothetical protein PLL88_06720 [Anaerolineaceae bacterium]|nr:hypothetical protein [Anaerolineaceae bacterium]
MKFENLADFVDLFGKVLIFAGLIEAVVQNLKLVYDNKTFRPNPDVLVSLAVSVFACVFFKIDIFKLAAFNSLWEPLGSIFTGILISRGAGALHDLLELVFYKSYQALHEKEVARKTSAKS